jgi:protein deglycase
LEGRQATCYPSFADRMKNCVQPEMGDPHDVVISKNVITSRGPGTSIQFGLAMAAALVGTNKADEVAEAILGNKFQKPSICDFDFRP